MGGFAGLVYESTVDQCHATGNVSSPTGRYVGGFIGQLASGTSSVVTNCYARGSVTGDDQVGGFVGLNYFQVSNTIDNCYSTGLVTGNTNVGGFCGIDDNTITNCFWDTETSGQATSDGGTGKTTTQMKTQSTFTDAGWDFTTIWSMTPSRNDGYPNLDGVVRLPYSQAQIIS